MIKKVTQIGDPILRTKSKNISIKEISSAKIKKLIVDLTDTMRDANLVGIAAPQIGINLNIFLVEIRETKFRKSIVDEEVKICVFINPKLSNFSETKTVLVEGCGSICKADLFGPVNRPAKVSVEAFDENGQKFSHDYNGLFAKVIQHEYDHLQGILCLDRFTDTRSVTNQENYIKLMKSKHAKQTRTNK